MAKKLEKKAKVEPVQGSKVKKQKMALAKQLKSATACGKSQSSKKLFKHMIPEKGGKGVAMGVGPAERLSHHQRRIGRRVGRQVGGC